MVIVKLFPLCLFLTEKIVIVSDDWVEADLSQYFSERNICVNRLQNQFYMDYFEFVWTWQCGFMG